MSELSMDNVIGASFGETASSLRVSYKKTILVRQYETEVIEAETVMEFGRELSGAERMLIEAATRAQLEYEIFCTLAYKNQVLSASLTERRNELLAGVNALKAKAEGITGKSMDYLFEDMHDRE